MHTQNNEHINELPPEKYYDSQSSKKRITLTTSIPQPSNSNGHHKSCKTLTLVDSKNT